MKVLIIAILASMLVGCTTQKKAAGWFDAHPEQDAERCAVKYPAKDSAYVVVDTAKYEQMVRDLLLYADSVTTAAELRNKAIGTMKNLIDSLKEAGDYSESVAQQLADEFNAIKPTDIPALTRSIEAKVRASIKPCKDSVIIRVDRAQHTWDSLRIIRLARDSTELSQMKIAKKQPGVVTGWLVTALIGEWWFWVILIAVAAFFTRKLWIPKIPFL